MERKKTRGALLLCLILFVSACVLSTVLSLDDTAVWDHEQGGQVVLSEVMSANRTYPAPNGDYLDFIEVRNLSADPVDISGYMLSDSLNAIGYTFPEGTVLPGYGYALCWCDKNAESEAYAKFGISRDGGEILYLYNSANVTVDETSVPALQENTSLIREDETTWSVAGLATPGYANTQDGYQQWLASLGAGNMQIAITEIVTDNTCILDGVNSQPMDYVELTNLGSETVDLTGAYLSNDPQEPLKWQIPALTLTPGERRVVYCGDGKNCAPFGLSRSGCTVVLTGKLGNLLSQVECPPLETDTAWVLGTDGTWQTSLYATPGSENDENGYAAWMQSVGAANMQIMISEVMTANRSTVLSAAGTLCDWVELVNVGQTEAVLDNCFLSDDPQERGKWQIPALTLAPGERAVIPCAGKHAAQGEASFGLSRSGCEVILSGPWGNILSQVEVPRTEADRSWALQEDGTYAQSDMPSPGFENTQEGYLAYRQSQAPRGALVIGEAMASNSQYLMQSDGKYYDWVELVNTSAFDISLSDYCLSDDPEEPGKFRLPAKILGPGERVVVICSDNDRLVGSYIQANFTLGSDESWVYVSDTSGAILDCIRICQVPEQFSVGRADGENLARYLEVPTPGSANGGGPALISDSPQLLTPAGVYEGVSGVTVSFQSAGTMYYTLDGSVPTEQSAVLTGAVELTQTSVVRVITVEEGKLASQVLTAGFILNEGHTLPVVSLSMDPENLFGANGIYRNNTFDSEQLCNLQFFYGTDSFTVDCGLELMGNPAEHPDKKSFKVNFRGIYGADVLGYPIFGGEGAQVFDALCLSAGSDEGQSRMRDELFSELCQQMDSDLLCRRSRYCVLYINGEYWGIYTLKEALGDMYYAQNTGAGIDTVEQVKEPVQWGDGIDTLSQYCEANDLSGQEAYDYVRSRLNTDALIDWMILQGYSCNRNIGENLRYYQSPGTGGTWTPVLSDLDGAFYYRDGFANVFAQGQPWCYLDFTNGLIQNEAFRRAFLQRLEELGNGVLQTENVLTQIDALQAQLSPEMERELLRWGGDQETWNADVDRLRQFISIYDHWALLEESLRQTIGLTDQEADQYIRR